MLLPSGRISRAVTVVRSVKTAANHRRISRLLVANRGEIALRVMKTARQMGIETVAVYSDADRNSMHVKEADFAYRIGPAPSAQSYLNMSRIIEVAKASNSQAIHPGYGFLSENANFAEQCAEAGLIFVGPPVTAIRDMGAKDISKKLMADSGVPVIEGYHGEDQSDKRLSEEARMIGYPVMLKAVYGGGGKGMRIVWSENQFNEMLASARSEASKAFGNAAMIVEKFIERPRHVEVQVFGDQLGNHVYLWERDCSVQRRHQKIIEEAPAPGLNQEIRRKLGETAVQASKAIGYFGAGTVEFIMNTKGQFYFMEMNTRLQVEHPVTEAITGLDLVEWQLRVAEGEELPMKQEEIILNGHALEARIYAEDTSAGFIPIAGTLQHLRFPSSARVDTGVQQGDEVSVYYDPMIAKIIVWDDCRKTAISKLDSALKETHIAGLPTNISFVSRVLKDPDFQDGDVYTDFIKDHEQKLFGEVKPSHRDICDVLVAHHLLSSFPWNASKTPFQMNDSFRVNYRPKKKVTLSHNDYSFTVIAHNVLEIGFGDCSKTASISDIDLNYPEVQYSVTVDGELRRRKAVLAAGKITVFGESQFDYTLPAKSSFLEIETETGTDACSPMPGTIDKILVSPGDQVTQGQPLIVMIAMKMEYIIRSPSDALIDTLLCSVGENVKKNAHLVKLAVK